jgi:hypothetical protein
MATYSFLNVSATMTGVGGSVNLAAGAAVSEEGITIESIEDKNVMTIGADGEGMHSIVASNAGTVTVRLLKTSIANSILQTMFLRQTTAGAIGHGSNTIVIRDSARGDIVTCTGVAFKKQPSLTFAKEGGMNEWVFDVINTTVVLGTGTPEI